MAVFTEGTEKDNCKGNPQMTQIHTDKRKTKSPSVPICEISG